ncbi:hypothetical protein [Brevibacillus sp. SYSU BS000544]|uniref:hypothetical protein n=1 Tax=Brevibacillus sp. SYSU BS000544 TaxID=3416443 RepID=UPI003CE5983D
MESEILHGQQTGNKTEILLEVINDTKNYIVRVVKNSVNEPKGQYNVFLLEREKFVPFQIVDDRDYFYALYCKSTSDRELLLEYVTECINLVNLLTTNYIEWKKTYRDEKQIKLPFIWCLVGNIVDYRLFGEKKEWRKGTKMFSAGTKVYCFPVLWGDGYESIKVIGRPRGATKLVTTIMVSKHITNWRMQKVYSSYIIKTMLAKNGWKISDESRENIMEMLTWVPNRTE